MTNLIERRDMVAPRNVTFDDFVQVEYVENTSDAYIDTLVNLKSYNYKFELDCQQTELKSQYSYLMAQEMGYENYRIGFYTNLNLVYAAVYGNQYKASTVKADEERHKYIYDKNVLYVDGVETVRPNTTSNFYNVGNHLLLLTYVPKVQSIKAKIYSCKIYENNTLVRDFIPVLQVSTRRYGLWDKVEGKFYVSPNGTPFSGKLYYDSEVQYLRSTGTQYMTFPLSVSAGTYFSFEGKVMPIYSNSSKYDVFAANPPAQFKASFYSRNTGNTTITYASTIGNESGSGGWGGRYNRIIDFKLSTEGRTVAGTEVYTELIRPLKASISQFRIFGGIDNTNRYPIAFGRVRIIAGDDILYDLIPVRVGNVGYMYDKLTNVLHQNEGTGNFTLGPDVG